MSSCVELVYMFDLLDLYIFIIITRCLRTKYSLLLFWHYFFPVFLAPCCPRPVHPCDLLKFTSPSFSRSPRRHCPMCGSHIVTSCAHLQLCSHAKCPPHFHFRIVARWTASAVFVKALILAFGILSHRDMPEIFCSIFLLQT